MKFFLATLIHAGIALVLVWGIVLAVHGKLWLLLLGSLAYLVGVAVIGCLPKKSH